ncbi:MAG: CHAT domain-containing protein [Myxococcota bacterium]
MRHEARRRKKELPLLLPVLQDRPSAELTADRLIELQQEIVQLAESAAEAKIPSAAGVLMGLYWEWTNEELAEHLGVSKDTARRRKARLQEWARLSVGDRKKRLGGFSFTAMVLINNWESHPALLEANPSPRASAYRGRRTEVRLEAREGTLWAHYHCAHARHIGLFACVEGGLQYIDHVSQAEDDHITIHRVQVPADTERVIAAAFASLQPPERFRALPEDERVALFWIFVFGDLWEALKAGQTLEQIERDAEHVIELGEASTGRARPELLKRGGVIPKPSPASIELLQQASEHGKNQRFAEAASTYRQALATAESNADVGGVVQASVGLYQALNYLGFLEAAERVLVQLLTGYALDARWASWITREIANARLNNGDIVEARRWLERSSSDEYPKRAAAYHLHYARLLVAEGNVSEARSYIATHEPALQTLRRGPQRVLRLEELIMRKRVQMQVPSRDLRVNSDYLDLREEYRQVPLGNRGAKWLLCQSFIAPDLGDSGFQHLILEQASTLTSRRDGRLFSRWQQRDLVLTTEQLDNPAVQRDMMRAIYLHSNANERHTPLLAAARGEKWLLWLHPNGRFEQRPYTEVEHLRRLTYRAQRELRRDVCEESVAALGRYLFPEPLSGPVWVASDGLLTDIPWWAAHHAAYPDETLPLFREILGPRMDPSPVPASTEVASLADPGGDLPGAADEVSPDQARVYLRGAQVTRRALSEAGSGLLVLGVHTQRGPGGRYLEMADGPLYPEQLASMDLQGAVVYLSGCTTAPQTTLNGVEYSFANALLQAGAGRVLAYSWSVHDEAARQAAKIFLQYWPVSNLDLWFSMAIAELIEQGVPPHVWGGIHVY